MIRTYTLAYGPTDGTTFGPLDLDSARRAVEGTEDSEYGMAWTDFIEAAQDCANADEGATIADAVVAVLDEVQRRITNDPDIQTHKSGDIVRVVTSCEEDRPTWDKFYELVCIAGCIPNTVTRAAGLRISYT